MSMVITRKTVAGTGWPLRNPADMFTAFAELAAQGWTGGVTCESIGWKLRLSADGKQTVNAVVGQWLVLDGDLKAVSAAAFDEAYSADDVVEFPTAEEEPAVEEPVVPEVMPTSVDSSVPIVR